MSDEFKVQVVSYPDRDNLVLRWRDPISNRFKSKSAGTKDRKLAAKAAGALEQELRAGRHQPANKLRWQAFRERLEIEYYPTIAATTQLKCDVTLDAVERILSPDRLSQVTNDKLSHFVAKLRCEQTGEGETARTARGESTIAGYMRHLMAILRWAHDLGMLQVAPKIARNSKPRAGNTAKGRAVTAEEFERMLACTQQALLVKGAGGGTADKVMAAGWQHFLNGLWLSGFRIGEALRLSWTDERAPCVDLSGRRPVVRFPAGTQKNGRAETWPCPPDFAAFLAAVPEADRRGRVFKVATVGTGMPTMDTATRIVSRIGKRAGIVVGRSVDGKTVRHATAHDLRRSFCTRWARLVMPQVLCKLARHGSITTTMAFYVTSSAESTGDTLYEAFEARQGNKTGNTASKVSDDNFSAFDIKTAVSIS